MLSAEYEYDYLAEQIHASSDEALSARAMLSLVVWILKREVRAIRGCLGMHRR